MKIGFWNINDKYGKNIRNCINSLGSEVDILILAEAYGNILDATIPGFSLISPTQVSGKYWIKIFQKTVSTINIIRKTNIYDNRIVISQISVPGKQDFYLCGVHLTSKVGKDDLTQFQYNHIGIVELHDFIRNNHDRMIVVGDFNHNPFDSVLISKGVFNSIPSRKVITELGRRTYKQKPRAMFYNPMWNFLGDHDFTTMSPKINGTYFLPEKKIKLSNQLHWNLIDQVIISHSIQESLNPDSIKIVHEFISPTTRNKIKIAADQLYGHGSFINSWFSDHLPITFEIDTNKIV